MKCTFICVYINHYILCFCVSVTNLSLSAALFIKHCYMYYVHYKLFLSLLLKCILKCIFIADCNVYLRYWKFFLLYFRLFTSTLCLDTQNDSLLLTWYYPLLNNRRQKWISGTHAPEYGCVSPRWIITFLAKVLHLESDNFFCLFW
jgi:hypothetical protein